MSFTLTSMQDCPYIRVGILDNMEVIKVSLNGPFRINDGTEITGSLTARAMQNKLVVFDEKNNTLFDDQEISFKNTGNSTFTVFNVKIGIDFHWEKEETQTFKGDLILKKRSQSTVALINEISLEEYLESVISSEMNNNAPVEFLKAHAIISRSWALFMCMEKEKGLIQTGIDEKREDEIIRWYEQESHDLYHLCADDHCQRYQGITKVTSENPKKAVRDTYGTVITYDGNVCDTRYSKACGGITEEYKTAWKDMDVPYLKSIPDGIEKFKPVRTEDDARQWIMSEPKAFCNTRDRAVLKTILTETDLNTEDFFRWKTALRREELEEIIRRKSGFDIGQLKNIIPIKRGPSGRIYLLKIVGSKKTLKVGKELEIRRWLSHSHLLSSAFVVEPVYNTSGEAETFIFYGAGWGHGVGLCQIGAGVMAMMGYKAEEILAHYFPFTKLEKIY